MVEEIPFTIQEEDDVSFFQTLRAGRCAPVCSSEKFFMLLDAADEIREGITVEIHVLLGVIRHEESYDALADT